jgi:hypothetical protein
MAETENAALTAKEFRDFVELYTMNHADVVKRLGHIETMLWQGQRIEAMADRLLALAEATGHHELAEPFIAPPGLAQPASSEG